MHHWWGTESYCFDNYWAAEQKKGQGLGLEFRCNLWIDLALCPNLTTVSPFFLSFFLSFFCLSANSVVNSCSGWLPFPATEKELTQLTAHNLFYNSYVKFRFLTISFEIHFFLIDELLPVDFEAAEYWILILITCICIFVYSWWW